MMKAKKTWQKYFPQAFFVACSSVPLIIIAYLNYFQSTHLTLDFYVDELEKNRVAELIPGGQAAQHGLLVEDRILSINGKPIEHPDLEITSQNLVLIQRQNEIIQLSIPGTSVLSLNLPDTLSADIASLAFWGVGVLLMLRCPGELAVRLFFILSQIVAISVFPPLIEPSQLRLPTWVISLSVSGLILIAPLLLHYLVTFPVYLGTRSQRKRMIPLAYLIAGATILAYLFHLPYSLEISAASSASMVVLALGFLIFSYHRRSTPEDKRRIRLLVAGNLIAALPPILFFFLPRAYHINFWVPQWLVSMTIIVSPVSHLVATLKHNLLNIDRLLNRSVVFSLISAIIFSLFLGTFFITYRYLPGELFLQSLLLTVVVLALGVGFNGLRNVIQNLVDRLFYGGWYDYPGVVETISQELAKSLDWSSLHQILCYQVSELMQLHPGELSREPIEPPDKGSSTQTHTFALHFQGKICGTWTPGTRLDGESFHESDLRILNTISKQAELAFGNVLLVEELRRQLEEIQLSRASLTQAQQQLLRSREEERGILARELHDGPIQGLVSMNLQLGLMLNPQSKKSRLGVLDQSKLKEVRAQIQALTNELRQVCADLRPPMLDTLGLSAAVHALVTDWCQQNQVAVILDLPVQKSFESLPIEVALNIYRIAQECLRNITKHAQAKNVIVRLNHQDAGVTMQVIDDGKGFAMPASQHALTSQGHFGVAGMFERAALINARLSIDSHPDQGTNVTLFWPRQ